MPWCVWTVSIFIFIMKTVTRFIISHCYHSFKRQVQGNLNLTSNLVKPYHLWVQLNMYSFLSLNPLQNLLFLASLFNISFFPSSTHALGFPPPLRSCWIKSFSFTYTLITFHCTRPNHLKTISFYAQINQRRGWENKKKENTKKIIQKYVGRNEIFYSYMYHLREQSRWRTNLRYQIQRNTSIKQYFKIQHQKKNMKNTYAGQ